MISFTDRESEGIESECIQGIFPLIVDSNDVKPIRGDFDKQTYL